MVKAELVLEVLVLLLDRPPLMRQADQARQAGRGGQVDEVLFAPPGWAQSPLAQEPHLGREPPLPPVVRGGHPQGGEVGRPGGRGSHCATPRAATRGRAAARPGRGPPAGPGRATRRADSLGGRRAAAAVRWACPETGSARPRSPRHRAGASATGPAAACCCRHIRRRRPPP